MVVIGLGSNVGNREAMLDAAVEALSGVLSNMRVSSRMETPALLLEGSPPEWNTLFLNMAVAGECALSPRELLVFLKNLEVQLGRKDRGRWAPREIDLDILLFDDVVMNDPDLVIPHPEMWKREFVVKPLAELGIKQKTKLVGILNLTPDSFSDGGKYEGASAIERLEQLIAEGADVVDIGAESTRPNATPLDSEEEWARLQPFFAALTPAHLRHTLSLDTRHAINAKRALDKGFQWINDVSGFSDAEMRDAVAGYDCTLVAMHSLTVPADKNITLPEDCDVIAVLKEWMLDVGCQMSGSKIIFDAGIGFGKTAAQSWYIINRVQELKALGFPLLIGHSRKSFLQTAPVTPALRGGLGTNTPAEFVTLDPRVRGDDITLEISKKLITAGVEYIRVHDVAAHKALL